MYRCLVLLLLLALPAFAATSNDSCDSALQIPLGTIGGMTCDASPDGSSMCSQNSSVPDVWYKYTATADGIISASTVGSSFDTVLSVHSGCPGTTANQIVCNDDCGNPGSCLSFLAKAGETYWIRVGGFQNVTGGFELSLTAGGAISGKVTDAKNGAPLEDVQILLYTIDGTALVRILSSDHNGNFSITGLTTGLYIARTNNSQRYVDELYDNQPCEGVTCSPFSATPIQVTGGTITSGINFALDPGGNITGIVTDSVTGLPLKAAEVHLHDPSNHHISLGTSDDAGVYNSFDGLPPGDYIVFAFSHTGYVDELYNNLPCPGATCSGSGASVVAVTAGATTSGINFALDPGGRLAGTITDSVSGLPVSGIQINIHDSTGLQVTSATSDATGHFASFDGLPAGDYFARTLNGKGYIDELYSGTNCTAGFCNVTLGTPITVPAGANTDIPFPLKPGPKISGKVSDADTGNPLQNLLVEILDSAGRHLHYEFPDSAGKYSSFYALPDGNYYIRTLNQLGYVDEIYDDILCYAAKCAYSTGTPVAVSGGAPVSGIDFPLRKGGTISGTVTESSTGLPLNNVTVAFYDSTGTLITYGFTDPCGEYTTIYGNIPSNYFARTFNQVGLIDEVYSGQLCFNGCDIFAGQVISADWGEHVRNIDFSLTQILLSDDFLDGIVGWNIKSGTWTESSGMLTGVSVKKKAKIAAPLPWNPSGVAGCSRCNIQTAIRPDSAGAKVNLEAFFANAGNRVELTVQEGTTRWKLKRFSGGKVVGSKKADHAFQLGVNYSVNLIYDGEAITLLVDGVSLIRMPAANIQAGNISYRVKGTSSFGAILVY